LGQNWRSDFGAGGEPSLQMVGTSPKLRERVELASFRFENAPNKPKRIQLHFVKDELIGVEPA